MAPVTGAPEVVIKYPCTPTARPFRAISETERKFTASPVVESCAVGRATKSEEGIWPVVPMVTKANPVIMTEIKTIRETRIVATSGFLLASAPSFLSTVLHHCRSETAEQNQRYHD